MTITICYAVIYFLEACILLQYCRNLFTGKRSAAFRITALTVGYFILFVGSFQENFTLNLILFLSVHVIFLYLAYDLKPLTVLFHSLFITITMVLSELVIISLLSYFAPDFYNERTYFRNIVILSVISKLIYFFILQFTSYYIQKRFSRKLVYGKSSLVLNVVPLMSCGIAIVFTSVCMNIGLSFYLDVLISVCTLLLLVMNIFLAWYQTMVQEKSQQFLELQLLLQKEHDTTQYFHSLYAQDEKQKILIHDIRRHLLTISNLARNKEYDKITAYIDQIVQSSDLQESVRFCDNKLLNAILYRAKQQARSSDATLITDIRSGCVDLLSEHDITALFGNLLDNALEATQDIPRASIELDIRHHNANMIVITLINSCRSNPFTANKQLFTTKPNKLRHGYGLKSVQRVVEKYHGESQFYFDSDNFTFHSIIMLKSDVPITDAKIGE